GKVWMAIVIEVARGQRDRTFARAKHDVRCSIALCRIESSISEVQEHLDHIRGGCVAGNNDVRKPGQVKVCGQNRSRPAASGIFGRGSKATRSVRQEDTDGAGGALAGVRFVRHHQVRVAVVVEVRGGNAQGRGASGKCLAVGARAAEGLKYSLRVSGEREKQDGGDGDEWG